MNQNIIEQLKEVFTPIALKIGEGAEFGWEVALRQQYIQAIVMTVWSIGALIALIFAWKWGKKILDDHWDEVAWFPLSLWVIVWIFVFGIGIETTITHLLNPEFYAIEFFISLVK